MAILAGCGDTAGQKRLVLAATTSLEDTGLLDHLATHFTATHPQIVLAPVAVGTGQAIQLGRRGDADVLLSHDSAAETRLVQNGVATARLSVMYNDFVIAGPASDPARIRGLDAVRAFQSIASSQSMFVSRGDDSGTHRREVKIWREAGLDPKRNANYIEAALGMGDALLLAGQKQGYILADRGTYLRFRARAALDILVEDDSRLLNSYGVTILNGARQKEAELFAKWITSQEVQRLIAEFGREEFGRSLFVPSAHGAVRHDTIPTGER